MVDRPHIHIQNRMMKPLETALSGVERGEDCGRDLTNIQCKIIQNCPESSRTMNIS
jgi:hypothetical protein